MDRTVLMKAEFEFCQDGNTIGTTEGTEVLNVALECQLPGEGFFVVIKSETGWSVNDAKELSDLVSRCEAVGLSMNAKEPDRE